MTNGRRVVLLLGVLALLPVASAAAADSPTETLRGFFAQANKIVTSPDPDFVPEARRHVIRALAYEVFDFREAAALALGPDWQGLTPAERDEFTRLFAHLLESGYVATMGSKASLAGGLTIDYVGETVEGDAAIVRTLVLARGGNELTVDYQMLHARGRWAVRDVIIDGLSLVANYRAQFQRVIRGSSYAELVDRMRARAPDAPVVAMTTTEAPVPAPVSSSAPSGASTDNSSRPSEPATDSTVLAAIDVVSVPAPASAPLRPDAAVAAAADVAPAVPATTSRRFWVQVGAFRDERAVIALMERLRQHAVTLFNAAETTPAGRPQPVARVLVGPFAEWADAAAKLRELQASGLHPFIAEVRE